MSRSFLEAASNPTQYDEGELIWTAEGNKQHFTRRMLLEAIDPVVGQVEGAKHLDIGSGQGWLCSILSERGAITTGIEPSERNVESAQKQFPDLTFHQSSLLDFETDERFDLITALMVFEHLHPLNTVLGKLRTLLSATGHLVIASGDYERYTKPRFGYDIEIEPISDGEVAARTDYKERAGVFYDIFRTPEKYIAEANTAGFVVNAHVPVPVPQWVLAEQPQYAEFADKPMFQIFDLTL